MQVPLGPSRFPTLVWHRAALVGLALLKFLTPPPPRAGTDRDRPSLRASLLRPKLGTPRNLGSFRAPSIRRALPALLGGLLCAFGSAAMAQTITGVTFVSQPSGGTPATPVYIIDDPITVAFTFSESLSAVGSPRLQIQLSVNPESTTAREAACAVGSPNTQLLCSYTVTEGDVGDGVSVAANAFVNAGSLPTTTYSETPSTPDAVDGVRLEIAANRITVALPDSGDDPAGAKAGEDIEVTVAFANDDQPEYRSGFGVSLVFDNAERPMTYVSDAVPATLRFRYTVVAGDNARAFGLKLTGPENLQDNNGNKGFKTGEDPNTKFAPAAIRRIDTRGPAIAQVRVDNEATSSAFVAGQRIRFVVDFDEKLGAVAEGTVNLDVVVGSDTVSAPCVGGDASAAQLVCTYTVAAGQLDTNGVSIGAIPLAFGAALKDEVGNVAVNRTAAKQFGDAKVDAVNPTITRADVTVPAAREGNNIVVRLTFSESVDVSAGTPPTVAVTIQGGVGGNAVYARKSSATTLEFRYSLTDGDTGGFDDDGVCGDDNDCDVTLGEVTAGAGVIEDAAGNDADVALPSNLAAKKLRLLSTSTDGASPRLESIALRDIPPSGRYGTGNPITIDILFSEPVTIDGAALKLRIGSKDLEPPPPIAGDRAARLTVTHTVALGDCATAPTCRISVSGIALPAQGNSILDSDAGETARGWMNDSEKVLDAVSGRTETTSISRSLTGTASVDTRVPEIESLKVLANPGPTVVGPDARRYYGKNAKIWIEITMTEEVDVTTPAGGWAIPLAVDGADQPTAMYLKERSGGKKLVFQYTVPDDDAVEDLNGIQVLQLTVAGDATVADLAGNPATFAHDAVASPLHRVDGSLGGDAQVLPPVGQEPGQPVVSPVRDAIVRSTTPTGGYYKSGDTIRIEVPLNPAVTFTSAPQLLLNLDEGGSRRITAEGTFSSAGTPRTSLVFNYPVESRDEDVNGFTGTLSGGGTLSVADGKRVNLGGITISSSIKIDSLAPELDSLRITSSAGSDGTYTVGDNIVVSATFSEDVERQGTADPSVPILVGDVTRTATLQSPNATSGGDTWVFSYKVAAGDNDSDGVSIAANALKGALEDAAGNEADIAHSAVSASTSHKVDTQGPSVTAVALTGAGDNNLFLEGETITATVTFDEEVDVARTGTNAVRVRFNIGTEQRTATYAGGDGTETLTFTYEVVEGDTGQISLPADALQGEVEDAAGNEAEGTLALSGGPYTVDASAPMLVEAPSITSSPPNGGDTYAEGDLITLQVSFDEPVMVTGEPRLPMQVGPKLRNIVVYTSGSGTDTLTFSYTVRNGDNDDNGVSVAANALRLPSGVTIQDVNGLTAAIEHDPLPDQPGHKVDAIAPGIESVAITSTPDSDDAYLIDEMIEVTVTFSEDIATDGTPTLDLMVGDGVRAAACAQGSASTQLTCSYTVVANDFDADGISVDANMLKGTITDMVGNPATLTHEALADDPAHKVYAAAPEAVRTIDRLSLAAGGGTNSLDLTGIFTGFQLSYAAVSSNTNVATATVSGTDLTVVSGMEGTARVTVTASNLAGEASVSFDVLVATDPAETAVLNDALAAIGRSMLSSTASVIGSRFELASTGSQMALGGSRFGGSLSPQMQRFLAGNDPFALEERMSERALFSGSGSQQAHGGGYGLTADRLLTGTSFNMPLNAMGTGDAQFAVWGAGDLQSFEGEPDDGMYDGSSSSGYIGVDARGDGWLAGVSVSRSGAEADYDFDGTARVTGVRGGGTLETSVTAFHPYARLEVGADSEVWVIGGFGGGEADLSRTHVTGSQSSDLSMAMAVGGLRRALAMEFGGADLSLRGDAGFLSLETDSGAMAVDGLSASVSRLRLGLEAAWEGESATPFVEVSGRFDGGDGQTGGGLELAGGLRILNPESGFGLEAKGRILAMHTGDGYSESGIGVTASFEPGAAGRGITFRLSPRWGGSADSTDLFWDEVGNVRDASQYAYGLDRAQTWGVDAALGYGFGLRSMPGVVTPFGQMDVTGDQDQRIRVGVRYGLMQGLLGGTQVELSAERVDGEMHRIGETRVLVSGRARF